MSKVWFITGCSKGFGWVLTQELLKSTNTRVVATARNPDKLKELQREYPDRLLALKLDVTVQTDIDQAVSAAMNHFHRIDVLVNNAGYGLAGVLEECTNEDIVKQFQTNVFGLMFMTKAVLPIMRSQKEGHILNISSVAGLVGGMGSGMYCATKFAVEGFSESLAQDVAHFGIKVTIIEPGPFRTDFAGASIQIPPAHPDYPINQVNDLRQRLKNMHGNQQGDPEKAAKIMIQITEQKDPPLRLVLGNNALERIFKKFDEQFAEIKKYEALSRSADYDAA
jgi:NAD(P)-dependent dehydrogenase (short-subunit alcohol dehydrogenase family)